MMKQGVMIGAMLACVVAGGTRPCRAQEEDMHPDDDWGFTLEHIQKSYIFNHDALHKRADQASDMAESWREGDTGGTGYGIRLTGQHEKGRGTVSYVRGDYDYTHRHGNGVHQVKTTRRDFDVLWSQITGARKEAFWGWNLGYNYVGMDKDIRINEKGNHEETFGGQDTWQMLVAGYFGENWVFGREYFNVHGSVNIMFGEASGIARVNEDTDWDGDVDESYENRYSLAYGANASVGVGFRLSKHWSLGIDYEREWLYSFKATDTGVVLFPDNNDALFIENNHSVFAYFGVSW